MAKVGQAQETSMEDILASIRRIISDDDAGRGGNAPHLAVVKSSPLPSDAPFAAPAAAAVPAPLPPPAPSPPAPMTVEATKPEDPVAAVPPPVTPTVERQDALTEAANALADFDLDDEDDDEAEDAPPPAARIETKPLPPPRPVAPPVARTPLFTPSSPRPGEAAAAPPPVAKLSEPAPSATAPTEVKLLSPEADQAVQSAFNQLTSIMLGNEARTLEDLVTDMMRPMLRDWLDDNLPPLVERLVREEIERVSRGRR